MRPPVTGANTDPLQYLQYGKNLLTHESVCRELWMFFRTADLLEWKTIVAEEGVLHAKLRVLCLSDGSSCSRKYSICKCKGNSAFTIESYTRAIAAENIGECNVVCSR